MTHKHMGDSLMSHYESYSKSTPNNLLRNKSTPKIYSLKDVGEFWPLGAQGSREQVGEYTVNSKTQ